MDKNIEISGWTITVDGWTIRIERGYGGPPAYLEMDFFCVVPPRVRTETRVDKEGLKLILPKDIYTQFMKEAF